MRSSYTRLFMTAAFGVLSGAIGGFVVDMEMAYGPRLGFFMVVFSGLYGIAVGELLVKVSGPDRLFRLEPFAAWGLILGALGGRLLVGWLVFLTYGFPNPSSQFIFALVGNVFSLTALLNLLIAVCCAVGRIRFQKAF